MTQIIFEQEKKQSGFLPKNVLTGLVRAGGETANHLRRTLTAPLGLRQHIDHIIENRVQDLINRGELAKEEGLRLRDKLLAPSTSPGDSDLESFLQRRGIPSRDELQQLHDKIDTLFAQINKMSQEKETE